MDPNLEAIRATGAEWVIAVEGGLPPRIAERIQGGNQKVLLLPSTTIADSLDSLKLLGDTLGVASRAEALLTALKKELEAPSVQKIESGRSGIVVVSTEPLVVAGPGTFVSELMELAGVKNRVPKGPVEYPVWDGEELAKAAPEWIFIATMGSPPRLARSWILRLHEPLGGSEAASSEHGPG